MIKRQVIFLLITMLISSLAFTMPVWKCIAKNKLGAAWNYYNRDKERAIEGAKKYCSEYNNNSTCDVLCLSPMVYWRCVAHDTRGRLNKGSWYWMSDKESEAKDGALKACEYNSQYGGCYVKQESCASS